MIIKKADIALIVSLLLVSLTFLLFLLPIARQASRRLYVKISVYGKEYAVCPLEEERTLAIPLGGGESILKIKNGTAEIIDADCPDKLCIRQGSISRPGESIVCLPNGLIIEITGAPPGLDAIAR